MIDVKQAVSLALRYTADLFGADKIRDLALEEVEHSDDGFWNITVGFAREERPDTQGPFRVVVPMLRREYKIVKLDDQTGEVKSVKMRSDA